MVIQTVHLGMQGEPDTLAGVVASTLEYETLPEWDVFNASAWAVEDTVRRVSI